MKKKLIQLNPQGTVLKKKLTKIDLKEIITSQSKTINILQSDIDSHKTDISQLQRMIKNIQDVSSKRHKEIVGKHHHINNLMGKIDALGNVIDSLRDRLWLWKTVAAIGWILAIELWLL